MERRLLIACCCMLSPGILPGGIVRTVDGQKYDGAVSFGPRDELVVALPAHQTVHVPWTNLLSASFASRTISLADYGPFDAGWATRDVGSVSIPGTSGQSNGTFAASVAGAGVDDKLDGFHFIYHPGRAETEVETRVTALRGGDLLAKAGVMIRENLTAESRFVMMAVTANGTLTLLSRAAAGAKTTGEPGAQIKLPCWVKLQQRGTAFSGYYSLDRTNWTGAGSAEVPLKASTWTGMALSSHSDLTVCAAVFEGFRQSGGGLRGEYFRDESFGALALLRIDPEIDFRWGHEAPDPALPKDLFSVRWTGYVEPRFSETYHFSYEADDRATVWVNGTQIRGQSLEREPARRNGLPLYAGRKYALRIDYVVRNGPAAMRLEWSSASQPRETIPSDRLSYVWEANPSTNSIKPLPTTSVAHLAKGILCRDGTFVAATGQALDDAEVQFRYRNQSFSVPSRRVSQIIFDPPAPEMIPKLTAGRAGVLLRNGEFFEGEISRVNAGAVQVNSVLFGMRTFSVARENMEVTAVVLRGVSPLPATFRVRASDGSSFQADWLTVEGEMLIVRDRTIGRVRLPQQTVEEIQRENRRPH